MKLKHYHWVGTTQQGKIISGETSALNRHHLKFKLQQQNIFLQKTKNNFFQLLIKQNISTVELTRFLRQLATLITANIPLMDTLKILHHSQQTKTSKYITQQLINSLENGKNFSTSLRELPQYFNELTCQLVYMGEQTGTLDKMLLRIADHQEKMAHLKNKVKQALFYPSIIFTLAIIIFFTMMIFVIPSFANFLQNFHDKIPAITRIMIDVSYFIRHTFYWLLLILFSIIIISYYWQKKKNHSFNVWRLIKLPWAKKFLTTILLANFCRNLAISLAAGITLTDALRFIAENSAPPLLPIIAKLQHRISSGRQFHTSLAADSWFPPLLIQMIKIGEEAGKLDIMLDNIATQYETDINQTIARLCQMIEPLIMIVLGALIGGIVLAMYLPIFKLGNIF